MIKYHKGEVYYDPRTNMFFQTRQLNEGYWVCGSFTPYHSDAQTTLLQQSLSLNYIKDCVRVVAVDQCEAAHFDGIGWRTTARGIGDAEVR